MVSQPLPLLLELAFAGSPSSEKMAIFGLPDLGLAVFGWLWGCGSGDAGAKGSIFAARAGRTAGRAGLDGSGTSLGRLSNRCWNSPYLRIKRSVGRASFSMPML